MGPREEDNSILLLGVVTLICGAIAFVPWIYEPALAEAANVQPSMATPVNATTVDTTQVSSIHTTGTDPARIIVPFTPNTAPNVR